MQNGYSPLVGEKRTHMQSTDDNAHNAVVVDEEKLKINKLNIEREDKRKLQTPKIQFSHHWHELLFHRLSTSYQHLRQEMLNGWLTPALDQRYKASVALHQHTKSHGGTERNAMQRKVEGYRQWARTVLRPELTMRKMDHQGNEEQDTEQQVGFYFLDIGCAPGGLSSFLHGDLHWHGLATSLSVEEGGMPMVYPSYSSPILSCDPQIKQKEMQQQTKEGGEVEERRGENNETKQSTGVCNSGRETRTSNSTVANMLLRKKGRGSFAQRQTLAQKEELKAKTATKESSSSFFYFDGNFLRPTEFNHLLFKKSKKKEEEEEKAEEKNKEGLIFPHSMDFVMAGAVQDQSQRGPTTNTLNPSSITADEFGRSVDHSIPEEKNNASLRQQTLERVHFVLEEIRFALRALKPGGTLMFVYGPSDCVGLLLIIFVLCAFIKTTKENEKGQKNLEGRYERQKEETLISLLKKHVHVLPTMHVEKSPVYVLVNNLKQEVEAECLLEDNKDNVVDTGSEKWKESKVSPLGNCIPTANAKGSDQPITVEEVVMRMTELDCVMAKHLTASTLTEFIVQTGQCEQQCEQQCDAAEMILRAPHGIYHVLEMLSKREAKQKATSGSPTTETEQAEEEKPSASLADICHFSFQIVKKDLSQIWDQRANKLEAMRERAVQEFQ